MNATDLTLKYQPQSISEILLPEDVRQKLAVCFRQELPHPYMLVGPTGTGKTLTATNLRKDSYFLNCLKGCTDNELYLLERAASAFTLDGLRRLIILDDVDHMLPKHQLHLIYILDHFRINNDFILTAREPFRIKEALRSRVEVIDFGISDSKVYRYQIMNLLIDIASKEAKGKVDLLEIKKIVRSSYPDIRKMIRKLQSELSKCEINHV
jgi:DNA polymerase III delta prime subunit